MRIRWSPEAAGDFERIVRRIQKDNPSAARNVANTIYKGVASLKDSPHRGRSGRIEGSRESYPLVGPLYCLSNPRFHNLRCWPVTGFENNPPLLPRA